MGTNPLDATPGAAEMTLPVSERMKINSLLWIAADNGGASGFAVVCWGCNKAILPEQDIRWDHGVAHGLGGEHHYKNIRPMHKACHDKKTFGTKATTKGSDIHMIAAAKRIARGGKKKSGRKIKSRGFQNIHRPMQSRNSFKSKAGGWERRKET